MSLYELCAKNKFQFPTQDSVESVVILLYVIWERINSIAIEVKINA